MFKQLSVFRIGGAWDQAVLAFEGEDPDVVEEKISHRKARNPSGSEWHTYGFAPMGDQSFLDTENGATFYIVQRRERILPGSVITTETNLRKAFIEDRDNRKMGKRELAELKGLVVADLLPESHIKTTDTLVMVHKRWLMIGSASTQRVDDIVHFLRTINDDFAQVSILPLASAGTGAFLKDHALDNQEDDVFVATGSMRLINGSKGITLKNLEIGSEEVEIHLNGSPNFVAELAVEYREIVVGETRFDKESLFQCRITNALTLRGIRYSSLVMSMVSDHVGESESDPVQTFHATAMITAEMMVDMVRRLKEIVETYAPETEESDDL